MALSFGVTVLPDPPVSRLVELMKLGEDNGFEIGWTYDSHVLWQESFVTRCPNFRRDVAWIAIVSCTNDSCQRTCES